MERTGVAGVGADVDGTPRAVNGGGEVNSGSGTYLVGGT